MADGHTLPAQAPAGSAALVHGPLAHWARTRPDATAVEQDGIPVLGFATLQAQADAVAARLQREQGPADRLLDDGGTPAQRLVELLGTLQAGRCAAIGDAHWPDAQRHAVRATLRRTPPAQDTPGPATPFYIGFTSGSSGAPKGFRRSHRSWTESFRACAEVFGDAARGPVFVPGDWSSSLALFGMLLGLWGGGGIGVLSRFSAGRMLAALASGRHACVVAVPSQLIALLALARRRSHAPLAGVRLLLIGGAAWPAPQTPALRALFPQARCISFYGASETSFISWRDLAEPAPDTCVGRPFPGVELQLRDREEDGIGRVHVRSPLLFDGYVGPAAAQAPGAAQRDADGWLGLGDLARFDTHGRLLLAGRAERLIVTGGHKVPAELVEACLAAAPGVAAVSVQALADDWRGAQVVAVVQPAADARGDADALLARLAAFCRERLPPVQRPRRIVLREEWPLTPAGKTDHPALARWLQALPPARRA